MQSNLETIYKKVAAVKVKWFYQKYKEYYRTLAMDYEDLKQEVLLKIWQGARTDLPSEEEFLKHLHAVVRNALYDIKDKCHKYMDSYVVMDDETGMPVLSKKTGKEVELHQAVTVSLEEMEAAGLEIPVPPERVDTLFDDIKPLLTDQENHIIRRIYVDGWTLRMIAKELGSNAMAVMRIQKEAINKLKKVGNRLK